jgi:hypothetical protein
MVAPPAQLAELRGRIMRLLKDVQRDFACDEESRVEGEEERWAMTVTFAPTSRRNA